MRFLAFFRAKYFFVQNSRVLRALIGDFWEGFVKKFRNESLPLTSPESPLLTSPLGEETESLSPRPLLGEGARLQTLIFNP